MHLNFKKLLKNKIIHQQNKNIHKIYNNLNEIIQMITEKYKDMKHYMTLTEGDDKYIIRFNDNDKICFLIEEV